MNYGSFIGHHDNPSYKLLQDNYKLRQKIITNYSSFITNYDSGLLKTTAKIYCKLPITSKSYKVQQLLFLKNLKFLITSNFTSSTYYGSFYRYYKLRKILLQITADIINYDIITNYVVTVSTNVIDR